MTTYVLDPSVAAKWFLPAANEPLANEALQLLRQYTRAQVAFIVPDLFFPEFGNVLWKAERRGRCTAAAADAAVREMTGQALPIYATAPLLQPALQLARAYERTVYDCVYLALAIETNTHMLTADEKLANSAAGLPVAWLGLI